MSRTIKSRLAAVTFALLLVTSSSVVFLTLSGSPIGAAEAATTVVDDVEDGDVAEYGVDSNTDGDGGVSAVSSPVYEGDHAIDLQSGSAGGTMSISSTSGLNTYPSSGDYFQSRTYLGQENAVSNVFFGYQDANNRYQVDVQSETDDLKLFVRNDGTFTALDTANVTVPVKEWVRVEVDWNTSGNNWINASLIAQNGTTLSTVSAQNTSYKSGGIGFGVSNAADGTTTHAYHDMLELGETPTIPENQISGTVVSQTGKPVSGVEVQAYGINFSHPDISGSSDPNQTARDALNHYTEAIPDSWDSGLNPESDVMESADVNYVAVTTKNVEDDGIFTEDDFSEPQIQVGADEEMILTEWDPTKTGGWGGQNEWDEQLPGSTVDNGAVDIDQISAAGGIISSTTVQLDETETSGGVPYTDIGEVSVDYASVNLEPGYYRISADGNTNTAYIVQVGDEKTAAKASTRKLIAPNLTKSDGTLSDAAKPESDALADNKLEVKTATTGPNGQFTVQLPHDYETVSIQALGTVEGENTVREYGTAGTGQFGLEQMRDDSGTNFTERSYVISTGPKIKDVPASGVTLEVIEMSSPPMKDLDDQLNKSQLRDNILENLSFSDLPPALQGNLSAINKSRLEDTYSRIDNLSQQNQALEDRVKQLLAEKNETSSDDSLNETINLHINPNNATRSELTERIAALNQGLTELRSTIESGEGEPSTSGETVSWVKPFDTSLDSESALVRVHYTNGTTRTLDTGSKYVSVNNRLGRDDEVVVKDLPLGTAAGAGLEISVATEDGTGQALETVENPAYSDEMPTIDAMSLSSLRPGPSEQVEATLKPSDSAPFNQLEAVTVRAPNGSEMNGPTVVDSDTLRFETNGSGIYSIRATFSTPNGKNHTLVQRLSAGNSSVDMNPGIRVKESSPFGTMAIVGDGFSSGDVSVEQGGQTVSILATVPDNADAPNEIDVHATDLSLPPDATVSVRVAKGEMEQTINKHIETTVHLGSLSEKALVYRNGDPMPDDSKLGDVNRGAGTSTIQTHTDDRGALDIRTIENPTLTQRAWYRAQTLVPNVSLVGGLRTGTGVSVGILPLVGLLFVGKRRRNH